MSNNILVVNVDRGYKTNELWKRFGLVFDIGCKRALVKSVNEVADIPLMMKYPF